MKNKEKWVVFYFDEIEGWIPCHEFWNDEKTAIEMAREVNRDQNMSTKVEKWVLTEEVIVFDRIPGRKVNDWLERSA